MTCTVCGKPSSRVLAGFSLCPEHADDLTRQIMSSEITDHFDQRVLLWFRGALRGRETGRRR